MVTNRCKCKWFTPISLNMIFIDDHPMLSSTVKQTINSNETTKTQTINHRHIFVSCCSMSIKLNSVAKDKKLLILMEYIVS